MLEFNLENIIEAIRFDVDYHCPGKRNALPSEGKIDKCLAIRVKRMSKKEGVLYPPGMRRRIFSTFGVKGTIENHSLFDEGVKEFDARLRRQLPQQSSKKRKPQNLVEFS